MAVDLKIVMFPKANSVSGRFLLCSGLPPKLFYYKGPPGTKYHLIQPILNTYWSIIQECYISIFQHAFVPSGYQYGCRNKDCPYYEFHTRNFIQILCDVNHLTLPCCISSSRIVKHICIFYTFSALTWHIYLQYFIREDLFVLQVPVYVKCVGHVGHFQWLGPNVWLEI